MMVVPANGVAISVFSHALDAWCMARVKSGLIGREPRVALRRWMRR
jgi:hypothetical protein